VSASLTIVNGHDVEEHDWSALAASGGTLVFLMPVGRLEEIALLLIAHGRAPGEPAAVVEWATTPRQRVITAPLRDIAADSRAKHVEAPAVLVVGPTVALATELSRVPQLERALAGVHG
jgi:siroheme synthase